MPASSVRRTTRRPLALAFSVGTIAACNSILDIPEYGPRAEGGQGGSGAAGANASGGRNQGGSGGAAGDGLSGGGSFEGGAAGSGGVVDRGGSGNGGGGGRGGASASGSPGSGGTKAGEGGDAGSGGIVGGAGDGGMSGEGGASGEGGGSTGPHCQPAQTECSATCVDTQVNANHCGVCGHSCLGGTCTAGKCQPVTLASGRGRLFMVQVAGDYVYYGGDGTDVRRVKKDGSGDIVLAPASPSDNTKSEWTYSWTQTPSALLWGNDWVHTAIRGCDLPDCVGGARSYVTSTANLHGMAYAASNTTVYFDEGTTVRAKVWPSGSVSDFATGQVYIGSMITDDAFLYWSNCNSASPRVCELRKKAFSGGSVIPLVTTRPTGANDVAVQGNLLYWSEDGPQIYVTTLPNGTGSAAPTLFGNGGGYARFIAVSNRHVYWTAASVNSVQRCPLAGCSGTPEVMASTTGAPWGITVDSNAVYWVTESGQVGKVAF